MRIFNKHLLGAAALICSGTIFAACPPISGWTLTNGQNVNAGQCIYTTTQANPALQNPKLCTPGNRLTDPNWLVKSCSFNQFTQKCTCTIVRK